MTEAQEYEYEALDELLEDVYQMYGKIEKRRSGLERTLGHEVSDEAKKEFERTERLLSDAEDAIRGRLNELDEDYCVRTARYGTHSHWYNKRIAELAKAAGVNCVALSLHVFKDEEDAIGYIVDKGLASLNYESTCKAVKEFRAKRDAERWQKYREASDIDSIALDLKVRYADLDAVIEYLRANGFSGCGMSVTCAAIERYYAEKCTA